MAEEIREGEFYTLTDEDGKESQFQLIDSVEMDGGVYYALVPEDSEDEYVILKLAQDEDGEDIFITIVDQTSAKSRYERRDTRSRRTPQRTKTSIETQIAKNMLEKANAEKSELDDVFDDDDK